MDDTYFNLLGNYNYTYWNESFSGSATKDHSFTNYTGSYAFNVGLEDLNFNNLQITTTNLSPDEAFKLQHSDLFTGVQSGELIYSVLQNGTEIHTKADVATALINGMPSAQLAEFGVWNNRRMIDDIHFTPPLPWISTIHGWGQSGERLMEHFLIS